MIATPSQTLGPFFGFGLTRNAALASVASSEATGTRLRLRVRIVDGDGLPVSDAMVEAWQADADGSHDRALPHFHGFGRAATDADGCCTFDTIRPGKLTGQTGEVHAPHINLCLFMRGLLRHIFTRVYFSGDPWLEQDVVMARVPEERRGTLVARPAGESGDEWTFDIRLQGESETVFFDV